jgi:hypothetical protein
VTDLILAHGDPAAERGPQLQVEVRVGPEHWVAVGELEGQLLVLQARDLAAEEVELVRVSDVAPYVEGTRQLD